MTTERKAVAAYIPHKTLMTATEVLEQGLPRRLDRSAFPSFSGSMQSWLLSSFTFLGFTDENGYVQPLLDEWVARPENRKELMGRILREKYGEVVRLAREHGTPQQLRDEIEKLGVSGTTTQRAVRFFISSAEFAGIDLPPSWKKARFAVGSARRRKSNNIPTREADQEEGDDLDESGQGETVSLASGGTVTLTVNANLLRLTPPDRAWLFGLIDKFQSYDVLEGLDELGDDEVEEDDA